MSPTSTLTRARLLSIGWEPPFPAAEQHSNIANCITRSWPRELNARLTNQLIDSLRVSRPNGAMRLPPYCPKRLPPSMKSLTSTTRKRRQTQVCPKHLTPRVYGTVATGSLFPTSPRTPLMERYSNVLIVTSSSQSPASGLGHDTY